MEIQSGIQVTHNATTNLTENKRIDVETLFSSLVEENGYINSDMNQEKFKSLSFEEAKALELKLEKDNFYTKNNDDPNGLGFVNPATSLLQATTLTGDEEFNKALFETLKEKKDGIEMMLYLEETKHNIEYSQGRRKHPYPTINIDEVRGITNNNFNYKPMSKEELQNIDMSEYIKFMIQTYEQLLMNLPHYLDRDETQQSLDNLKELNNKYTKNVNENNATLEYLTKNNKENPLLKNKQT